jgi:chemotaxis signal transduction protein
MFTGIASNLLLETKQRSSPAIELVVFQVDRVSFGIPMTKINRIISNVFIGEDFSLTQDVKILDLHYHLSGVEIANFNAIAIFTDRNSQLCGIPIETAPILVSVPADRIRILPTEIRTDTPLGIASHIAITTNEDRPLTILILGD